MHVNVVWGCSYNFFFLTIISLHKNFQIYGILIMYNVHCKFMHGLACQATSIL